VTGRQLTPALLCLGALALGATAYLGSPWPGVSLAALSLVPWGGDAWLSRAQGAERQSIAVMGGLLENQAEALLETQKRLTEQGEQLSSLRNSVSMRGLGG
jgi:hypothetical protein